MRYQLAADAVVVLHAAYVAFIVLGQLAILVGILARWRWVRNPWFRWSHLTAIAIVVVEALWGVVCPLTVWESWLRSRAGQTSYSGDFIAYWTHEFLFFDFPNWVFTLIYVSFGLLVLATFLLAPPRGRSQQAP
jgi:hypothetical protein